MRLCGSHLVHQVGRIDGLVLLRLGVQQLRVKRCAEICRIEPLVLLQVATRKEALEVGVAVVGQVELIGLEAVALRPEAGRVVLRQALVALEEALVKRSLLREVLRLGRGQELGVVEARRCCWEGRSGVKGGVVLGYVIEGVRRRRGRIPYMTIVLARRGRSTALLHNDVI